MKKLNIGIIAHVDAGKTTLTENILYVGGVITKAGRVDKGDTQTDSMTVERRRGISVRAAATSFFRGEIKFNLIDTPGHVDFVAEVERNLAVLDGVVLVISAKEGLQSQTRILMDTIMARKIPAVIFLNKIDRLLTEMKTSKLNFGSSSEFEYFNENAAKVVRETNEYMDGRLVVIQRVTSEGEIRGLTGDEFTETAAETIFSHDDNLMAKFANDEKILPQDFYESLKRNSQNGILYPVFFGSALYGIGVENLLDALPNFLPTAENDNSSLSAVVFKVDNSGKERLAYVRLYSGRVNIRENIYYRGKTEKITRLAGLADGKLSAANSIEAGDIAVFLSLTLDPL